MRIGQKSKQIPIYLFDLITSMGCDSGVILIAGTISTFGTSLGTKPNIIKMPVHFLLG